MGYVTIIALDLGKFKTVACVMDVATRQHLFETIAMSPANVHELVARDASASPAATLVVFETCDTAGWVHDVCTALGVSTIVVNANDERWRWRGFIVVWLSRWPDRRPTRTGTVLRDEPSTTARR